MQGDVLERWNIFLLQSPAIFDQLREPGREFANFWKISQYLGKDLINLTCWQYGCDSMLGVGGGQGWLPNATLSGKLRGRGGGGDTIQIFSPQRRWEVWVRKAGRERGGWRLRIFSNFGTFLTSTLFSLANRHNYTVKEVSGLSERELG